MFLRLNPGEFNERIAPDSLRQAAARIRGDLRRATQIFETYVPLSFQIDLSDLSTAALVARAVADRLRRGDRHQALRLADLRARRATSPRTSRSSIGGATGTSRSTRPTQKLTTRAAASSAKTTGSTTTSRRTTSAPRSRRIASGSTAARGSHPARAHRPRHDDAAAGRAARRPQRHLARVRAAAAPARRRAEQHSHQPAGRRPVATRSSS